MNAAVWPDLPYAAWRDTAATLQLWTQIVGKIRLMLTPWLNHGWQVPLYVTARGLGTSPISAGGEILEIEFDFISHRLVVRTSRGETRELPLEPRPVADFYHRVIELLNGIGVAAAIHEMPNEVPNPIPFSQDRTHAAYDPARSPLLARAHPGRSSVQAFSNRLLGQGKPCSFPLGQLRPRRDPFLWAARSAPSRRRPRVARRGDARSLFARSQQRRVLAGQ